MELSLTLVAALVADVLLGEPRRYHPLAGFGALAERVERRLNQNRRLQGCIAAALLVGLPVVVAGVLAALLPAPLAWILAGLTLMAAVGRTALIEHAEAVARPLAAGDLAQARRRVAWLVSRDTDGLEAADVRVALLESVLENASDAIFASLFWFIVGGVLAGPAGAVAAVLAHRLANTLDAMWGIAARDSLPLAGPRPVWTMC